jgi:cytochrome P450
MPELAWVTQAEHRQVRSDRCAARPLPAPSSEEFDMAEATVDAPDLFGPEFTSDPYPAYRWLREHSPVHRLTLPQGPPAWLVTRHADGRC